MGDATPTIKSGRHRTGVTSSPREFSVRSGGEWVAFVVVVPVRSLRVHEVGFLSKLLEHRSPRHHCIIGGDLNAEVWKRKTKRIAKYLDHVETALGQ